MLVSIVAKHNSALSTYHRLDELRVASDEALDLWQIFASWPSVGNFAPHVRVGDGGGGFDSD